MKHLILLLISLFSIQVNSQIAKNPHKVTLNFSDKKFEDDSFEKLDMLIKGEFYQIEVSGINQNLWNVSLESQDSFVNSTVSFPTFGSLGIDGFSALVSGIKTFTNATITKLESQVDIQNDVVDGLNAQLIKMADTYHIDNSNSFIETPQGVHLNKIEISELKKVNNKEATKFLEKYNNTLNQFDKEQLRLNKINEMLIQEKKSEENILMEKINESSDSLKVRITRAKDSLILPLDITLLEMNMLKLKYLAEQQDLIKCLDHNADLCKYNELVESYRIKINNSKKSMAAIKSDLDKFIAGKPSRLQLMKNDSTLKVSYKELDGKITNAIGLLDKALDLINQDKLSAFMQSIVHLENSKGTTWTSLPIQHLGDIGKFEINITPKSTDFGLPSYKQEYAFHLPNTYTGVSAGFYLGIGTDNESYSILETKNSNNTSDFEIIKENDQNSEIGFTTLIHFGKKYDDNQDVGYHLSVGPAISLSSVIKPRLCIGGGFSFGKYKNMLTIDVLLLTGYFDVKSNIYDVGLKYSSKPEQITVSKLGVALALNVGYIYKF